MRKPKPIYLDYAASTPLRPEAARAMRAAERAFGNPSSLHSFGQAARAVADGARERVAAAIGAPPAGGFREIIFTGSATEANNLALRGTVRRFWWNFFKEHGQGESVNAMPHMVTTAIEHESMLETVRDMGRRGAARITILPAGRGGLVAPIMVERALESATVLVSVMQVNNETGAIQPVAEISKIVKKINSKILVHTDAAQAFQFFDCDVNRLGVDLMTLSAHKVGGPKGIGALYVRDAGLISPVITGGGQEFGIRSGTENVAAIAGFAEAAALAVEGRTRNVARVARLRELLLKELKRARVKFMENVPREGASPHILNLRFPDLAAEELLVRLDLAGVAVSAGSACTARAVLPSHVLLAMGMPKREVEESIRISFGTMTTAGEVREAARRLAIATQEMAGK